MDPHVGRLPSRSPLAATILEIPDQFRELKDELGLDHFEGRSYRGWTHHAVLAALTSTCLQRERRRGTTPLPTFPDVRNWIRKIVAVLF